MAVQKRRFDKALAIKQCVLKRYGVEKKKQLLTRFCLDWRFLQQEAGISNSKEKTEKIIFHVLKKTHILLSAGLLHKKYIYIL